MLLVLCRLRQLPEKVFRSRASSLCDWPAWGVEQVELSESESREVARLCMLSDCVSLEFIRANRVTFSKNNLYKIFSHCTLKLAC